MPTPPTLPAPRRNTEWTITLEAPLLRPGMTLTAGPISERYVVEEIAKAMEMVREINQPAAL